jgi:hypothetical protein
VADVPSGFSLTSPQETKKKLNLGLKGIRIVNIPSASAYSLAPKLESKPPQSTAEMCSRDCNALWEMSECYEEIT